MKTSVSPWGPAGCIVAGCIVAGCIAGWVAGEVAGLNGEPD